MKSEKSRPDLNAAAEAYFHDPGEGSLEAVVKAAERFVFYFRRLYGADLPKDDLYQAGMEGLLKALKSFDPEQNASFSTYAGHLIIGEIRHLVRKESAYKSPGCIIGLQRRIRQVMDEYLKETGCMPSTEYVAGVLGVREQSIVEGMRAGLVSFEELDLSAFQTTIQQSFRMPIEDRLAIHVAFQNLTALQRKLFSLLMIREVTQEKAALQLGMTQRQVSRAKVKMLHQLGEELKEERR